MYYIFTHEECPKCESLKIKLKEHGHEYVERDTARLKNPEDEIDKEALVEASLQNMTVPVVVEIH